MKCLMCSQNVVCAQKRFCCLCSCFPFSSLTLIFTLLVASMVASISHFQFLAAAIKFLCSFCNEIHLLCFLSLAFNSSFSVLIPLSVDIMKV